MQHEFWLLEEGRYTYGNYKEFAVRKDAPFQISDDVLHYFSDTLFWIPTLNPALVDMPMGQGLNWHGPTIINKVGGKLLYQIFTSWSELFTSGPEQIALRAAFEWQWPFGEQDHRVNEHQLHLLGHYKYLKIDRNWIVQMLTTLAYYGKQASTGQFFILHLGI